MRAGLAVECRAQLRGAGPELRVQGQSETERSQADHRPESLPEKDAVGQRGAGVSQQTKTKARRGGGE